MGTFCIAVIFREGFSAKTVQAEMRLESISDPSAKREEFLRIAAKVWDALQAEIKPAPSGKE